MVARFLHFFPQYSLDDLRTMPVADYLFLLSGMLDVVSPQLSESFEEKAARATHAAAVKSISRARERGRRR